MVEASRLAVRLLHAGLRHGAVRALSLRTSRRPATRRGTGSPAISAAAPAIGRSSMRRSRPAPAGRRTPTRPARRTPRRRSPASIDGEDVFIGDDERFFAIPASVASLAELYLRHPDAVIVAGATDVGLWITKQLRDLPKIIFLHRAGLDGIEAERTRSCSAPRSPMRTRSTPSPPSIPISALLLRRLGSKQVRAAGTVGGNIANGSPIGDMPPALIALGGAIELRKGDATRWLPLEDFFIDYGKQDRAPGEFVARIRIPRLKPAERFRCYKVAKRFDQDISARHGRVPRFGRRRPDRVGAHRLRRHGGDAEARDRNRARSCGREPCRPRHLDGGARGARPRLPADRRSSGVRCATAPPTAQALLDKALSEIAGEASAQTRIVGIEGGRRWTRRLSPASSCAASAPRRLRAPPSRTTARAAMSPAPPPISTTSASRRHAPHRAGVRCRRGLGPHRRARSLGGQAAPGVVAVLTAADIPGINDCSPAAGDDPILADGRIVFHGQVIFAVVAETRDARPPRRAPRQDRDRRGDADPDDRRCARGRNATSCRRTSFGAAIRPTVMPRAARRFRARSRIGGQEHFYLEGQVALAVPREGGGMLVHSSTQHPTEVQHCVAKMLAVPDAAVTVRMPAHGRRLRRQGKPGGAVGGARGARRACDRPAGQDPARPRRRHDHDRQAPRLPRRLCVRLRPRRASSRRSMSRCWRAAATRPICPSASTTAPCSTPTTPISIRRCAFTRGA